jgi:diguanylate cyclase (GGDEF)-like protein
MFSERFRETAYSGAVAVFVFLSAWLSIELTRGEGRVAAVWLSNGVLLVLLLTRGNRSPLRILLVGFAANLLADRYAGDPLLQASALASINTLEVLIGYWLLTRQGGTVDLREPVDLLHFGLYAAIFAPAVCAATACVVIDATHLHDFLRDFRIWFLADALGMAIAAPVAYVVREPRDLFRMFSDEQVMGTASTLGLLTLTTLFVFAQSQLPLFFLVFPVLVLVAFRRGFGGATLGVMVIAVVGIGGVVKGFGPLAIGVGETFSDRVLMLQAYLACVIATSFPLAAVLGQRDRLHERLSKLVYIDALTDLPNRRNFDVRFGIEWRRAIRAGAPLSLMMIDVDEFKKFNDAYGHQAGDRCLTQLSSAFAAAVKRSADFVARYGGEEFVVLLPETTASGAEIVAGNLMQAVEALAIPHSKSAHQWVTVSIGIAFTNPESGVEPATLLRSADAALYTAKSDGRKRVQLAAKAVAAM